MPKNAMRTTRSKTFFGAICWVATGLFASSVNAVSFDVRGEYEYWKSGLGGAASGILGGLGVSHQLDEKASIGASAVGGKFNTTTVSKNDVSRFDLDLTAGYLVQPMTVLFAGYQLIQLGVDVGDDPSRSFSDQVHAFGGGVNSYYALRYKWYIYAGASMSGVFATTKPNDGVADSGLGFSSSVNGGLLYLLSNKMSLGVGFKTRVTNVNYGGDNGRWAHNATRATFSISRAM